jgi:hypothetical protein
LAAVPEASGVAKARTTMVARANRWKALLMMSPFHKPVVSPIGLDNDQPKGRTAMRRTCCGKVVALRRAPSWSPEIRPVRTGRGRHNGVMTGHPADRLLEWLPEADFAVMDHGFTPHGRDYRVVVQDALGGDPGTHELVFTHCVQLDYETRVKDHVWPRSWTDEFVDYHRWRAAGEPAGYVWGTNWSNAYPGWSIVRDSDLARRWGTRLGKSLFEVGLETDRFYLRLIFHSIKTRKLDDDVGVISQIHIPLGP